MAQDSDGDLGVDVLIVGGGLQGLFIARALHKQYSVAVVTDPAVASETLDSPGYIDAGYTGNDVARIQPARRAAGYWRLWAESNGVPFNDEPPIAMVAPEDEAMRTRLWSDATLLVRPAPGLPASLAGGSLEGHRGFLLDNDVVMDPSAMLDEMRRGIEDRIIPGEITKFGLITESAIDFVEVELTDGRVVPITPRYVVLASNVGNGALLQRLVTGFKDRGKRKEAVDVMRACQAVRRRTTIVARGDLPFVSGHFDGISVAAHRVGTGLDAVWVITAPIDDRLTVLGPEEVRFQPKLEPTVVRDTLERLFAASPSLAAAAPGLRWGAYVARKTEHPMMATPDTSAIAQPAPARLETLDMEGFMAVWPSHLGYTMIVGDVVAERVQQALGPATGGQDGLAHWSFPEVPAESRRSRWERTDFAWSDWAEFAGRVELPID